jgi:hypothetical protein
MVFWEAVEVGPVLAVNKVSRAAAEKKRERCFMVLIEWAVGEAIRRRLAHLYSATRHIKLKMVKNATKRSKSAVNRPPGLFLNRKSGGGGIARSAPALLPRCTAVRRIGAPAYPPRHRPRPHLTLQTFGRRTERHGWVVCLVPVVAGAAG